MDTKSVVAIVVACVALVILVALSTYSMMKEWQEIGTARASPEVSNADNFQSPVACHASKPSDDITTTEEKSPGMVNAGCECDDDF